MEVNRTKMEQKEKQVHITAYLLFSTYLTIKSSNKFQKENKNRPDQVS